jgi:hypothetical protein
MATALLGPRTQTGKADPGNLIAAGNYTAQFAPKDLNFTVPLAEVHHIAIDGPGGYIKVYINEDFWDTCSYGGQNSWDPSQPMLIRPGDIVSFYWSVASGGAPQVTIWLRHPA